ncbi:MAG TPA: hypothetical protein VF977_00600 [Candidatus Binatia bacterium]
MKRDDIARDAWGNVYGPLSAGRPGLTGAVLSRAEAQVLRLSVLYALLDCSLTISIHHLQAALAVWEFAEDSARAIFGDRLGDPVADRILDALRSAGDEGMTESDISALFGRNRSADEIGRAMALLLELKAIKSETSAVEQIIDDRTVAVLIDSTVLGAPIWFAFSADFDPGDGIPIFYADELALLKNKPVATLRKIYDTKKTFGRCTRVRQ